MVEECRITLDQRHLDAAALARMLQEAREASERFAREGNVTVSWERLWQIEPVLFDRELIDLCDEAIRETCGKSHRLPSGPLHDAAEVARAGVPTVMMFVQSLHGISHNKIEDTQRRASRPGGAGFRSAGVESNYVDCGSLGRLKKLSDASAGARSELACAYRFRGRCSSMSFRVGLVMRVAAAQERYVVEHALLEPFQRQINHGRDIERDQLRNDQAADNNQPERPARRAVGAKAERERQRAHQRRQRSHDDRDENVRRSLRESRSAGRSLRPADGARSRQS